jgi:epoxyqueuosine reductase
MDELSSKVLGGLKTRGWDGRIVSTLHVAELKAEIESLHERADFCEDFFEERLKFFAFSFPPGLPNAVSLIVVAAPQPRVEVEFTWNCRTRRYTIPPTYDESTNGEVRNVLRGILEPEGYRVETTALPLKLLAVRSGLAAYGKNNITYIPGMGSFYRLMAFYSDLPCSKDTWGSSTMMERCVKCSACINKCPTQAIDCRRFLLRAERCLTFHNERACPFPEWIHPKWHHCIVGCMQCQTICPDNKNVEHWVKVGATFSQEETALLLESKQPGQLPEGVRSQMEQLGLIEYLEILPRNLNALMQKEDLPVGTI